MQSIYRNKIAKHNKTKPMEILKIELFTRSLSKLDELISCSRLFINLRSHDVHNQVRSNPKLTNNLLVTLNPLHPQVYTNNIQLTQLHLSVHELRKPNLAAKKPKYQMYTYSASHSVNSS